ITNATGIYGAVKNISSGFITNARGLYIAPATNSGTISTNYGIYVDSQTVGGTNYAVYTNGAAPSSFGGDVNSGGNISATGQFNGSGAGLTGVPAAGISGTLGVASGGTGASSAASARINLSAAQSGLNTDITSLNPASALSVGGINSTGVTVS